MKLYLAIIYNEKHEQNENETFYFSTQEKRDTFIRNHNKKAWLKDTRYYNKSVVKPITE